MPDLTTKWQESKQEVLQHFDSVNTRYMALILALDGATIAGLAQLVLGNAFASGGRGLLALAVMAALASVAILASIMGAMHRFGRKGLQAIERGPSVFYGIKKPKETGFDKALRRVATHGVTWAAGAWFLAGALYGGALVSLTLG